MPNPYRAFVTSLSRISAACAAGRRPRLRRRAGHRPAQAACERLEQRALLSAVSLEVSLSAGAVRENAGPSALTGTVTRSGGDLSQALTVSLASSDPSEIRVPVAVTIAAGQTKATFAVEAVDDASLDGLQRVTITASAGATIVGAGTFVSSFGTSGHLDLAENVNAVVPIGDGRFYTVGYLSVDSTNVSTSNLYDIVVRRFHADGTADTTFGTGGRVQFDLTGEKEIPEAAALQSDGKLLVAGHSDNGPDNDQFLVRFTTAGALDPTFGTGGRVVRSFDPQGAGFSDVAVQSDGKIVAVGGIGGDLSVTRFNADGSIDMTFGVGGTVVRDFSLGDGARGVALQADGRIVVTGVSRAGNYDSKVVLVRLDSDGAYDASFGLNGVVLTDLEGEYDQGNDVVVRADGKIVVAAQTDDIVTFPPVYDFVAIRFNADGSLDPTFAGDGTVRTDFSGNDDQSAALALSPDGSLVVVGTSSPASATSYSQNQAAFARYSESGALLGSPVRTSFAGSLLQSVVPLADGRLLLGGWHQGVSGGRLTVYDPAGTRTVTTSATASLAVFDHETLTVSIPDGTTDLAFGETLVATVTRSNADDSGPYAVRIVSEDSSELIVPETVVIPAGALTASFEVRAVSNDRPDGSRLVRFAAIADGFAVTPEAFTGVRLHEPGTTTLDVGVDGYAADMNRDGVFDGLETFRATDAAWRLSYREDRGLLEFDVSSLGDGARIDAAGLSLDIISFSAGFPEGRVFVDVYGYAGDGALSLGDATQTATRLGTLTLAMGDTIGRRTIPLDAGALRSLVEDGGHVGFVIAIRTELSDVNGARIEWSSSEAGVDPASRPQLHLALAANVAPAFSAASYGFSVDENGPAGTRVGAVSATDRDGHGVTYAIVAGNEAGTFTIDPLTGVVTVADPSALDYESQSGAFALRVRATDDSADALWDEVDISVTIADVVENRRPAFAGTPYVFTAAEDLPEGSVIGTVRVEDPDEPSVSRFTFEIVAGNEDDTFWIDGDGRITLATGARLDFETRPRHELTVRVTDHGAGGEAPLSADATVAIDVANVVENAAPSITPQTFARWAGSTASTIGTVAASDPDGDGLTYEIVGGNEAGDFSIDPATGLLRIVSGRTPAEGDHVLTVRVTDDGEANLSAAAEVTVVVSNAAPLAAPDSLATYAGRPLAIAAADLLANDSDADASYGDALTVVVVSGPSYGTLTASPDGGVVYQPGRGFVGTDEFVYRVRDAVGAESEPVTVTIAVSRLPIRIDVDQSGPSDSLDLDRGRTVSVAILATEGFDPTTEVDVTSLTFGVTGSETSLRTNPKGRPRYKVTDVDGDGRLDLLVTFDMEDLGLTDADAGTAVELTLRGTLADGTLFEGVRAVAVTESVKKGKGRWK